MKGKRGKFIILTLLMLMTFLGLQSFAEVWINTIELTTANGVTVVPNQNVREDTTIINFAGYNWYVIGTNGINEMTLFAVDNWRENTYGSNNAHPTWHNNSWLNATKYDALPQAQKDLIKLQTLDGVADLKFFLLSKEEAEGVSNSIRGATTFWWTRTADANSGDGVYGNAFGCAFRILSSNSYTYGVRPAVTIDITGIDIDSNIAVARVVNRGSIPNKNAVNVNRIPVSKGTVTIIPNQDVSGSTRQEISFGGITWYAIGSNGKDKVTLLAKSELSEHPFRTAYSGFNDGSNEYFSSDVRVYLQSYLTNDMSSVSSFIQPVRLTDTRAPGDARTLDGNYYVDRYYQSDKLFLLSKYEVRDLHQSIRSLTQGSGFWWLRSPVRNGVNRAWVVNDDGTCLSCPVTSGTFAVRPALVLNLSAVDLSSIIVDGVETITVAPSL